MKFAHVTELGKIAGIPIYLHWWTVIPVFLLIVTNFLPDIPTWLAFLAFPILLGIVLLHEFGHALTAKKLGIEVKSITLTGFGGIANIEEAEGQPKKELLITLAGPAVNVVLAILLLPFAFPIQDSYLTKDWVFGDYMSFLFIINMVILVFNCLPIYPMDGGRVLKTIVEIFINKKAAMINVIAFNIVLTLLVVGFFISSGHIVAVFLVSLVGFVGFITAYGTLRKQEDPLEIISKEVDKSYKNLNNFAALNEFNYSYCTKHLDEAFYSKLLLNLEFDYEVFQSREMLGSNFTIDGEKYTLFLSTPVRAEGLLLVKRSEAGDQILFEYLPCERQVDNTDAPIPVWETLKVFSYLEKYVELQQQASRLNTFQK